MSTAALIALNVPVYVLLGRAFFGDWGGFFKSLRFLFTPDIISAFRGEFHEDQWESLRFFVWLVACAAAVLAEAQGLRHFGWM